MSLQFIKFLQGAVIADLRVSITPAVNYKLPPEALVLDSVKPMAPPIQKTKKNSLLYWLLSVLMLSPLFSRKIRIMVSLSRKLKM